MGSNLSQMTEQEFAESNRILMRMGNTVIDATDFVFSHPGGESAIRNKNKCDVTRDYNFHGKRGKQQIDRMIIAQIGYSCF